MTRDLLIGTYTERLPHVDGHADGVVSARFDGTAVTDVAVAARVENPSWVSVSPDGSAAYAVSETEPDGRLVAFARGADGALTERNSVSSGGPSPAHLVVHPSGRLLIAGTYGGGTVSVFALEADGSLGERTAFVQHEGRGPDPERQEAPHVHQLSVDPVTGDVVVVDLGLGEVRWYALSADGALTLRPEATVVVGSAGPRHLAFHPDGRHAVLANELDSSVDVLRRDGDRFVRTQSTTTRADDADGDNAPAAVCISASGDTVLVSNRGDDTVAVFAFDARASRVSLVASVPVGGRTPRDLVISPDGDRVLAACQDSDEVTVFAFDDAARTLRLLGASPIPTPVCLRFV
ncbi:lactonase family protein [Leifsonia sp. fls2-241-R2A-40a]|uniref:lactonase family protein n=1 Tax=Leifsonia sp. fls2-241-R2A-40a TaxID=3040290 RepID=UPI00254EF034|nr:lactonase family protein [Leifsonia sp. fls2-241-R2A-40a]